MVGGRRWSVAILVVLVLAGCRDPADGPAPSQTVDDVAAPGPAPPWPAPEDADTSNAHCLGPLFDVGDQETPRVTIETVVEAIRSGQCEASTPQDRLCRDLYLAAITDPIAAIGLGLDRSRFERMAAHHQWLLSDAHAAAVLLEDEELALALAWLADLDVVAARSNGDEALVAVAIARAEPSILTVVARAEQRCR